MSVIAFPKHSVVGNIGPSNLPQDIRDLRKSSMDYHRSLGQLAIHKHRWNEKDVREGRAEHCPFHSSVYERGEYDDYCFGTGYLGGFADGTLVPVTIGDAQEDVFRANEQGVLVHERHPGMQAPWTPDMGDTDMIIIVEIDPVTQAVTEMGDRYELREVSPITIRGPGFDNTLHMKPFKVSQTAMIDLLPYSHQFYNIPINFDYINVPVPLPPDYPPLPAGYKFALKTVVVNLIGEEPVVGLASAYTQDVRLGVYPEVQLTTDVRLIGEAGGTHFHF